MNREIKFRGLRVDIRKWVYGDLNQHPIHYDCQIIENGVINHSVEKDSIGQFTGLLDKNGVEIYEGDILQRDSYWGGKKIGEEFVTVIFKKAQFMFLWNKDKTETYLGNLLNGFFIVGNIHQNPELLK